MAALQHVADRLQGSFDEGSLASIDQVGASVEDLLCQHVQGLHGRLLSGAVDEHIGRCYRAEPG